MSRLINKVVHALIRDWVRRSLPHGLMSWRYLFTTNDRRLKLHRDFWWHNRGAWPRPLWCLLQMWLWLRWLCWGSWRASYRSLKRHGASVKQCTGLSLWEQYWRVQHLALCWCVPPNTVYCFGLHLHPQQLLDYVFDHELPSYHNRQSMPLGLRPASLVQLQDKQALADMLSAQGFHVVATQALLPRYSQQSLAALLCQTTPCFIKSRSGNQGRGAFAVFPQADQLTGKTFTGKVLTTTAEVELAWQQLLQNDDVLIQPLLQNHPSLAHLCRAQEVITLRYISQWRDGAVHCLSASLEVPFQGDNLIEYALLGISPSGVLFPFPNEYLYSRRERADKLWQQAAKNPQLPFWSLLVSQSHLAHQQFSDIKAIAWDWVLTPTGPIMLEGNSGWGTLTPQMINGPLLKSPS
ncbi:sugar-transfer associated ATP-grasp domain-containing protein [Celerinatantimonas yamalensis]|uniref:Sugar-transfer associated ATP-grasp domain-containing protein n=1 Tax=Celerinatantimonas yamalensis TaxID=559956 RepID=A0ABW9G5N4_9GAMM